mgnify:FL=1
MFKINLVNNGWMADRERKKSEGMLGKMNKSERKEEKILVINGVRRLKTHNSLCVDFPTDIDIQY